MSEPSPMLKTVAIKNFLRHCVNRAGHEPERLPSEMELTEKFNVSRSTVRAAIEAVEKSGYIIRLPGRKGAFTNPEMAGAVPHVVGIVVESGANVYLRAEHARMIAAVILSLTESFIDYEFVMLNGNSQAERIGELENYAFNAVIYFNDNTPESVAALNLLLEKNFPLVIVDAIDKADVLRCVSNSISYDFANIGYRHFRHVQGEGIKNAIYIGVPTSTFRTFEKQMSDHSLSLRQISSGSDFVPQLLSDEMEKNIPDAIFIADSGRYQAVINILKSREEWRKIKILGTFNTLLVRIKEQNPEIDVIFETPHRSSRGLSQYVSEQIKLLIFEKQKYFANIEYKIELENLS